MPTTGDFDTLCLALDWFKLLMQYMSATVEGRRSMPDELYYMCVVLTRNAHGPCFSFWRLGACLYAMRQLGASAAVMSWLQEHAVVSFSTSQG